MSIGADSHIYSIKDLEGKKHAAEPTIGRWYCGMGYADNADDPPIDGTLARYEGEGFWSSDDGESEVDPGMAAYDYLQLQH